MVAESSSAPWSLWPADWIWMGGTVAIPLVQLVIGVLYVVKARTAAPQPGLQVVKE